MIPTMLSKNGPTKLFMVTVENAKLFFHLSDVEPSLQCSGFPSGDCRRWCPPGGLGDSGWKTGSWGFVRDTKIKSRHMFCLFAITCVYIYIHIRWSCAWHTPYIHMILILSVNAHIYMYGLSGTSTATPIWPYVSHGSRTAKKRVPPRHSRGAGPNSEWPGTTYSWWMSTHPKNRQLENQHPNRTVISEKKYLRNWDPAESLLNWF